MLVRSVIVASVCVLSIVGVGCQSGPAGHAAHASADACDGADLEKCKRDAFAKQTRERWKRDQEEREREERRNSFIDRQH